MRYFFYMIIACLSFLSSGSCEEGRGDSCLYSSYEEGKTRLYGGKKISRKKVRDYLLAAGFSEEDVPVMTCIAEKESSFYSKAQHFNNNGSIDYGLFQINDRIWSRDYTKGACPYSTKDLLDPQKNALCARRVFRIQGYSAWYTFRFCRNKVGQ